MDLQAPRPGRVPVRVLLLGGDDGWTCEIVDDGDGRARLELPGPGVRWAAPPAARAAREPAWWPGRVAAHGAALRELLDRRVTDRTFEELGVEAEIAWFAVREPGVWEGLVTLREPDPARYPGNVPPYVVELEPERGARLPEADLLFSAGPGDAWPVLEGVAAKVGSAPPAESFICGYSGYRSVRVGRGGIGVGCMRDPDGAEHVREVFGDRPGGWGGNPELRFRLDGIDLLHEPAADVVTLFRDLGHEVGERNGRAVLPGLGLSLWHETPSRWSAHRPDEPDARPRFGRLSLVPPDPERAPWRFL
ncbi:hypothetical protein [Actinomadura atramentaria]|uniref:hypothetical protein n=1 Tax=Actinomadura atramentaria TaxID=1990 RepID=UPI0003A758DC|nr:hypothetical protein [Actinomadura atramentaria]